MPPPEFPFPLSFRRSSRAKRLRVTVRAEAVECVLPAGCSERRALSFVEQHRGWLTEKYTAAAANARTPSFWSGLMRDGEYMFPFRGIETPLSVASSRGSRTSIKFVAGRFDLAMPAGEAIDRPLLAEAALVRWAGTWMRREVDPMVQRYGGEMGLRSRSIRIKRMRTRWGSCGSANDINLNWLLALAPPAVLEYVVVHELCHIRHRDHSPRFWELVDAHYPGYPAQRAWLKAQGSGLITRFGRVR